MQSEIDLLRQHFTELEAKYVKIKAEKVELETRNAEIPELKKKVAEIEAENAKLRHIIEENARRDAENAEHKARIEELEKNSADTSAENAELKARVAKLEQESRQPQNDFSPKEHVDITESMTVHSPACETNDAVPEVRLSIDNPVPASSKSSEDRKTVAFLDERNKKNVSDSIRQRNREKKLCIAPFDQRESSEVALEVVAPITSDQTGSHDADSLSPSSSLENNHISHSSSQANSSLPVIRKIPYNQKVEQGIIQEVISFIQKRALTSSIDILESREIETVPGEGRDLAQLFSDAKVAEGRTLEAKRKELVCWYNYSESYQNKVAEICSKTGVAEKTAKSQVYAMIKASLPNVSDSNLYKKTERAGSVYKLFGKIIDPATKKEVMGIGIDKVYGISYGVRGISELSNAQILNIINRVAENARDILTIGQEQNHVTENSETNEKSLPIPEENSSLSADLDDYVNMLTGSLDDETANWGTPYENSARVEKEEVNEVKESPRVQSDDDVYFDEEVDHDSAPHPVEETDDDDCSHDNDSEEEMPDDSDDDGYNRYGGYNEYGECDRGYYYRDGGYERRSSPMMSPIISPVTA
ncbi:hypothetical protein C1646_822634 [Rhizophagus diaphanus]|nr:hypothetical protein C1646_822634 [Rhizophagus diaphanus] [Rhizophagus sp. MUCL 43196]